MNKYSIKMMAIVASSTVFASCGYVGGDNDSFETPTTAAGVSANPGTISQRNFSILADDPNPPVFDTVENTATDTTVVITVKIGDKNNQLLTDAHTVFFATEWGLIEPSCVTVNGTCSVTWQTSFALPEDVPADLLTTITAYTLGEEDYNDSNGNGEFDDGDTTPFPDGSGDLFRDREEPFVDVNFSDGGFNAASGDKIIDVMDGNDLGSNAAHDFGDGFLNSPNCTQSSLCSTVRSTIYIWDDIQLDMEVPPPAP
ncbi:MAG: hypothetical protein RQ982_12035 [Gammaproteobacteria bacterium]|nr:hypothetical protein [Gammaproteobacteria bacterium]